MRVWTFVRLASYALLALPLALIAGCGGGGSSSADRGLSALTLDWPSTTKAFVGSPIAGSARVVLSTTNTLTTLYDFPVVRPAGTTEVKKSYTLPDKIAPGTYLLTVRFCNGSDANAANEVGLGSIVATVSSDGSLKGADGKSLADVAFTSTLQSLAVVPNQSVAVGQKTSLLINATTQSGSVVVIPFTQIQFASSNGKVLQANDDGTVTGIAAGTANVTATAFNLQSPAVAVTVTAS